VGSERRLSLFGVKAISQARKNLTPSIKGSNEKVKLDSRLFHVLLLSCCFLCPPFFVNFTCFSIFPFDNHHRHEIAFYHDTAYGEIGVSVCVLLMSMGLRRNIL
jgi:hypothetical protein